MSCCSKARVCFADPPYNVKIDGNVCGLGVVRHREFATATGEMTQGEFAGFLESVFRRRADASVTARSPSSAWTGATSARSSRPASPSIRN